MTFKFKRTKHPRITRCAREHSNSCGQQPASPESTYAAVELTDLSVVCTCGLFTTRTHPHAPACTAFGSAASLFYDLSRARARVERIDFPKMNNSHSQSFCTCRRPPTWLRPPERPIVYNLTPTGDPAAAAVAAAAAAAAAEPLTAATLWSPRDVF